MINKSFYYSRNVKVDAPNPSKVIAYEKVMVGPLKSADTRWLMLPVGKSKTYITTLVSNVNRGTQTKKKASIVYKVSIYFTNIDSPATIIPYGFLQVMSLQTRIATQSLSSISDSVPTSISSYRPMYFLLAFFPFLLFQFSFLKDSMSNSRILQAILALYQKTRKCNCCRLRNGCRLLNRCWTIMVIICTGHGEWGVCYYLYNYLNNYLDHYLANYLPFKSTTAHSYPTCWVRTT